MVHVFRVAFEEAAAPSNEQGVASEHDARLVLVAAEVVADVSRCVAGREQTLNRQRSDEELLSRVDFARQLRNHHVPAENLDSTEGARHGVVASCVVPATDNTLPSEKHLAKSGNLTVPVMVSG